MLCNFSFACAVALAKRSCGFDAAQLWVSGFRACDCVVFVLRTYGFVTNFRIKFCFRVCIVSCLQKPIPVFVRPLSL